MLRILRRVRVNADRPDQYASVVQDVGQWRTFIVYETEGNPRDTICCECFHGTRCAHSAIVRQAAEAVIAARTTDASMGVRS